MQASASGAAREALSSFFPACRKGRGERARLVRGITGHETQRLSVQFGREVLASALGMRERASWKNCAQSKDVEAKAAEGLPTWLQLESKHGDKYYYCVETRETTWDTPPSAKVNA